MVQKMLVNGQIETSQADSQILHPGSRTLFRFWEQTRAEAAAPRRDAIDLRGIRAIVPNLAIVERGSNRGGLRWRLAGTAVCDLFRREITGQDVLAGWDMFERDIIGRFLDGVMRNLQPCVMRFRFHTDTGQLIGCELIALPVVSATGAVQAFCGLFAFRDIHAMGYGAVTSRELSGARAIWTEHLPGDQLVQQLAETPSAAPYRPFQVIHGGRR
jgi:hypothetical protein